MHHKETEEAIEAVPAPRKRRKRGVDTAAAAQVTAPTTTVAPRNTSVVPWMRLPVEIESGKGTPLHLVRGLRPSLLVVLRRRGIEHFYPVQAAAWHILAGGTSSAHDLCICAPTGSGKTLAYALPILQSLRRSQTLGALVIVPTRELAVQSCAPILLLQKKLSKVACNDSKCRKWVYGVFASLSRAANLWVGLAAAKATLSAEIQAFKDLPIDILVATPGRLMAHLKCDEPTFSLSALRFLVVDETDRMLRQAYSDWLPAVLAAVPDRPPPGIDIGQTGLVKVLASATLTHDPAKLYRLSLHAPRYIAMSSKDSRYKLPRQLKEFKVVCAATDKPLLLMALLRYLQPSRTIVFAGSLQAADRLYGFLRGTAESVALHSSHKTAGRLDLLAFKMERARVLVASDALTRGMDVPGVEVVINYDPADYPKTYVHRAGRTARAGSTGTVVSILLAEQVRFFKTMLRKVDNTFVKDFVLPPRLVKSLRPACDLALELALGQKDGAQVSANSRSCVLNA